MDKEYTQRKSYSNKATVTVRFVKTIACVNQSKIIDTKEDLSCTKHDTKENKINKENIYRQYI